MYFAFHKRRRIGGLIAIDIFAIAFSLWAANFLHEIDTSVSIMDMVIASLTYVFIMHAFRAYTSLWDKAGIDELLQLCLAVLLSSGLIQAYFIVRSGFFNLGVFVINTFFMLAISGGFRFTYRAVRHLKHRALGNYLGEKGMMKKVLIIGAGDTGRMMLKDMAEGNTNEYKPMAIIDDDPNKHGMYLNNVKIIGGRGRIEAAVDSYCIDEIIVALPSASIKDQGEIIRLCNNTGKKVRIIPGIIDVLTGKVSMGKIRDISLADLLGREPVHIDEDGLKNMLSGSTVLVTGGAGSIGSEIIRQCMKFLPKRVIVLDQAENGMCMLALEVSRMGLKTEFVTLVGSVRDEKRLDAVFSRYKPDIVFHAAAHKHVPLMEVSPSEAVKNNIMGTLQTAKAAVKYGTKRFIFISTDKAVNPTSIMGASKRFCEIMLNRLVDKGSTRFASVRFGNVLGSDGSVVPIFKEQIAVGGPVTVTHPDITRYFMLIPEAAQLVLEAARMVKGDELFVLDMGTPVKIADMARELIRLHGLQPDKDIKIEYTGLRPGEKMHEELFYKSKSVSATGHGKIFMVGRLEHIPDNIMASFEALIRLAKEEKDDLVGKELMRAVSYRDDLITEVMPNGPRSLVRLEDLLWAGAPVSVGGGKV